MKVLITGANRGLGYELCRVYAQSGHDVYAGVLEKADHSDLKALKAEYPEITVLPMDVTDRAQVIEAAKVCGELDVLINVAGVLCLSDHKLPITDADPNDFKVALDVNVMGAAHVIHAFHKRIVKDGWFIDITSEGGSLQNIGTVYPAYSVSKAAENKLIGIFRKTVSGYHIYAMHPGRMNTEMGREFAQIEASESAQCIYELTAGKRSVSPEADWFIDYRGYPMEV
ncbi:MAG: SDR family NAD(P)-dependent oxidoreductase [Clostridiales bacterium]|nr:SDR family NAD(P)-dependent oxidoreductase [Clostridiales bacterium]